MLDYGRRGKPYTTTAKQWTVLISSMAYENPELVEQATAALRKLRKKDDANLIANTEMYLRLGYKTIEAIYHGARVTLLESK